MKRCDWANLNLLEYHDEEWGVPVHDDQKLFEMLILEGAQAGLSWETVLRKREAYRKAFMGFNPKKVARMTDDELEEHRSFDTYIWQFVGGKPINGKHETIKDIPAKTAESDAISKDLKKRGMSFVGPTIMYAFMQAVGIVNDHLISCFRYSEVKEVNHT